jgi:hypothetical protein
MFSNHCPSGVNLTITPSDGPVIDFAVEGWPSDRNAYLLGMVARRLIDAGFVWPEGNVVRVEFPNVSAALDVGANDNVADKVTELILAETGQMFTYPLMYTGSAKLNDPENIDAPVNLTAIRAKVFGYLFGYAENVVKGHRGDLFHDTVWLTEFLTGDAIEAEGGFTFFYGVRETGTGIGDDRALIHNWNTANYTLRVFYNARRWLILTVTPALPGKQG